MIEEDICPICLCGFTTEPFYTTKCCNKNFHTICYINCMKIKMECPLCRNAQEEFVILIKNDQVTNSKKNITIISISIIFVVFFGYYYLRPAI